MNYNKNQFCLSCGYGLSEYLEDLLDEMCPCCGAMIGYYYDIEDGEGVKKWREYWLKDLNGKWRFSELKPKDWSLEEQMKNIPKELL